MKKIIMYVGAVFALLLVYYLFVFLLSAAPELSVMPYALTKALAGVITLKLVDELILYDIDTVKLLKCEPVGYAIYVLAYAIIIAASLAGL